MEGLHTVKALIQKNDWLAKVDLKDAFFMIPMAQQHRHLLLFTMGTETFQFNCLPFGLFTAPRVFTKLLKPAIELLRATGIRLVIYMDDMLVMAHSNQMLREHVYQVLFLLENLGFIINSKKSLLSPIQEIEFLGMIVNSQTMEIKLPGQKIKSIRLEARTVPRSPTTHNTKGVPASRETECHQPSPANGTSLLLPNSDLPQTSTGIQPSELSGSSQSLRPSHRRSQMVGAPPLDMEWEESDLSIDHPDHNNRCLTPRMGSRLQREENERIMVPPGTVTSHKLPRASSSNPGNSDICQRQVRDIGNPEDGQYNSSCIHQQERRDSIPCTITPSKGSVAMVHGEEHPHPSTAFTRVNELHSRHRVQSPPRQVGLEAGPYHFQEDPSSPGASIHRSICKSPVSSATIIRQLETRPTSHRNRCLLHGLVQSPKQDICQPSLGSDRQSPINGPQSGDMGDGASSSCLESSSLVSLASANAGQRTTDHSTISGDNSVSVPKRATGHHTTVSRVGYIRSRCESSNLSVAATDLVLSSWRDKSTKSYDSSFGKWACWCDEQDKNPISGPISDVANFLAELYENGYQYRSINAYRSAISSVHDKVDSYAAGQHPTVSRLMKGIFNKRPPQPKYSFTWDVQKVTTYISNMGDNHMLSLKLLSFKLVTLLALTRPSRSNDLSNLDLRFMRLLPEGVQFQPTCLLKQSRSGNPPKPFLFPSFPTDKRLCPKQTLLQYISRTESFRPTDSGQKNNLFISYIKPHNPITSSSIARGITSMLKLAGIDTETFKAHSTRSASASAAASAGLTTNQIMEAADWSSESVFQRFYYRPIQSNQIGVAVLSTKPTDSLQTTR